MAGGDSSSSAIGYWVRWRFLVCVVWVTVSMSLAVVVIWRREKKMRNGGKPDDDDDKNNIIGEGEGNYSLVYDDQAWMACVKGVHPAWLLGFRLCAFLLLLLLLTAIVLLDGALMFYYYTQWTFTLVTLYFAMGSLMSIRGCYKYHKMSTISRNMVAGGAEWLEHGGAGQGSSNSAYHATSELEDRQPAGKWGYAFQIVFQINGGAVMLTDFVFWFVIFPFLAIKDKRLNLLIVSMHSMNAIFLLGDTAINCLPFPFFRIGYFIIWTIIYVLFQWILHACVKIWWPYPFLDISSPSVPLWYLAVAVMHVPCYGMFAFIVKLKNTLFTTWFQDSYRGLG